MKISIWDLFKYIFKWKWLIAAAVAVAVILAKLYVDATQHIQSQIVIQFQDECISEGETPNGDPFDPYEIVSPDVLTGAINDLGLDGSVDALRSRITITPIIPDSETTMQEAKLDKGEEYEYHANTYTVTYAGSIGESEAMARDILDAVTDNYMAFYTTKYTSQAAVDDVTFDEDIGGYDYLEAAEIMDNRVSSIITSLLEYYQQDSTFRAPTSGKTFKDMKDEYTHLQEYELSGVFADIYKGQITKDKELLIKKYTQRKEDSLLEKQNYEDRAALTKDRMDNFAEANKNVPNAYNVTTDSNDDGLEIIQDVYDYTTISDGGSSSSTTTYDALVLKYAGNMAGANDSKLDAEHCDEVISKFTIPLMYTGNIGILTNKIEEDLNNIKTEMADLYKELSSTIDDFNLTNASKHIKLLTGVSYSSVVSLPLYVLIFAALALMASMLFAVSFEIFKLNKRKAAMAKNVGEAAEQAAEAAETAEPAEEIAEEAADTPEPEPETEVKET